MLSTCSYKTGSDEAVVTSLGRLFHTLAPATEKARPPTVDRRKDGTVVFELSVVFRRAVVDP